MSTLQKFLIGKKLNFSTIFICCGTVSFTDRGYTLMTFSKAYSVQCYQPCGVIRTGADF